jgi:hypothetical protein
MTKIFYILLIIPFHLFSQGVGVGTRIDLTQSLGLASGQFAQMFIPDYYVPPADGNYTLIFHLHSASWAAENEVYKANANAVLFNIHLGSFSSSYQNYFNDQTKFQRILDTVNARLNLQGVIASPSLQHLIVTSFSAGYAGVREVFKSQAYYNKIEVLILADGLHSSSDASMHTQMSNFVKFAKDARDGKKIFLLTHSSITTSGYQSTTQTANYLIDSIGSHRVAYSATDEIGTQYSKCDTGNFHLKGYNGVTADDHLKHLYAMHLMVERAMNEIVSSTETGSRLNIPEGYFLRQNYPNPFNPVTYITYGIPQSSEVSLSIYNITGELVSQIVSGENSPGVHRIKFDATGLCSGVYICTFSSGEYKDNMKMVLLK